MFNPRSLLILVVLLGFAVAPLWANNAWGCYHWQRSSNPVTLTLGDNVSSVWDSYLSTAESDWDQSQVLSLTVVGGQARSKNCRPADGKIEVCNASYGNNGWLGIAQIWASGCHIYKGSTRVNDYYFNQPQYNTPPWRRLVMCQEVGHDFGLDHQDENFNNPNLGTCMDYTNDPDGPPSNEHPNSHDYSELNTIYAHLDSGFQDAGAISPTPPPPAMNEIDYATPDQWGKVVERSNDGRFELYELDFGGGNKIFTFVTWAEPRTKSGKDSGPPQQ